MAILRDSRGRFRSSKSKYLDLIGQPVSKTKRFGWLSIFRKPITKKGLITMRYTDWGETDSILVYWDDGETTRERVADFPELKDRA